MHPVVSVCRSYGSQPQDLLSFSLFIRDRLIIPFIDRGDVTITVFLSIRTLSSPPLRQIEELNGCQEEKEETQEEQEAESEKQRARRKVESAAAAAEEDYKEEERSRFSVQGIRSSDTDRAGF